MQLEVLAELIAYLVAATVLTGLGLAAEAASLFRLGAGETTIAVWFGFVGLLALYAGIYMLGYEKVAKTMIALRS
ncbi:hypothetical protein SAMN06269185_2267 [Natronoarchaeum philippinense]|uniref:DUF8151 domain-containing protein n=1 Tax=Natronoarchaeum philippinense TaxID=558529 RepID=A0A285NZA5_NATPI|nr:hypothetical protein [Natronoarchaeum philippinense]SNZ14822.1 hypothetical protein SAMN06269185_2267 [Natronoarchaeum philippinense]